MHSLLLIYRILNIIPLLLSVKNSCRLSPILPWRASVTTSAFFAVFSLIWGWLQRSSEAIVSVWFRGRGTLSFFMR